MTIAFVQSEYIPSKLLISAPEAAELLRLSKTTVYTLIHLDDFPVVCLGGRTLIKIKRLQEWVEIKQGVTSEEPDTADQVSLL